MIPARELFAHDCGVVVAGTAPGGEVTAARLYDLPESPGTAAEIAGQAARDMGGAAAATIIVYLPPGADFSATILAPFVQELPRAGIALTGILRHADGDAGQYWWCLCGHPSCAATPVTVPRPASLDLPGYRARRAACAAALEPAAGPGADSMAAEIRAAQTAAAGLTARELFAHGCAVVERRHHRLPGRRRPAQPRGPLAQLAAALESLPVRDVALAHMDPAFARAHQRLWSRLTQYVPALYQPGPASLLAFTAWQAGDMALAHAALDRAQAGGQHHSRAHLLRHAAGSRTPAGQARPRWTPGQVAESYGLPPPPPLAPPGLAPEP